MFALYYIVKYYAIQYKYIQYSVENVFLMVYNETIIKHYIEWSVNMSLIDLTGSRFGRLTVIERAPNKNGRVQWVCQCDCGNKVIVSRNSLRSGTTQSCGCLKIIDLAGKHFGKLLVLKYVGQDKAHNALWLCRCDCGNEKVISTKNLLHSNKHSGTKSCGCLVAENHVSLHNKSQTRIYRIWQRMKARCYNQNDKHYEYYGGRGITICDEWKDDFQCFYDWSMSNGYTDRLTIDRIDSNGDYTPSNCRWATRKQQANNTRQNRYLTYNGKTLTAKQWSEELGINYSTIQGRIRRGLNISEILSQEKLY